MRILVSQDWDFTRTENELKYHVEWKRDNLPITITDKMSELISSGFFYMYGRDKSLHPITIFSPKVILKTNAELSVAMMSAQFVGQYILDHQMREGKVENWVTIVDLDNLGFSEISRNWVQTFTDAFRHNYYQRNVDIYLVNAPFFVTTIWKIFQVFVPQNTKDKMLFERSNWRKQFLLYPLDEKFRANVHPGQVQKKYGGEAANITEFWPPRCPNNEFGIDEAKLAAHKKEMDSTYFDASTFTKATNNPHEQMDEIDDRFEQILEEEEDDDHKPIDIAPKPKLSTSKEKVKHSELLVSYLVLTSIEIYSWWQELMRNQQWLSYILNSRTT